MKQGFWLLFFFTFLSLNKTYGEQIDSLTFTEDIPYVFIEQDGSKVIKWIVEGKVYSVNSTDKKKFKKAVKLFSKKLGYPIDDLLARVIDEENQVEYTQKYQKIDKFLAISDIHGQHDLFEQLLLNHGVIDKHKNWTYGKNHLVIVGDIMDRGDKVTESLWLLAKLEQQAKKKGGGVHYVIGNHELMVFDGDLRYINKKYDWTAKAFGTTYDQLFSKNTFFGRWLKQKPVLVHLNNTLFTHGGISVPFVEQGFTTQETNRLFVDSVFTQSKEVYRKQKKLDFLTRSLGPLWYRGYFKDTDFTESDLNKVLKHMDVDHIVVGHTTHPTIINLFDNRIFGIDSNIKKGETGEVLIYDKGTFYRGLKDGTSLPFND